MTNPVIVVVGAGPGLGASVAHRFGSAGYDVALVARDEERLEQLGARLQEAGVTAGWFGVDITDREAFAAAIARFGGHAGRIDVLHFNPSAFREADPLTLRPEDLLADVALGVGSLLTAVQAARPFLGVGSRILATGSLAADRPSPEAASLGVQKAGLRNLVRSIDATLAPDGIRAATLTVNGVLGSSESMTTERVADALFGLTERADDAWETDVAYSG